jgi:hypothetical protein
MTQLAEELVNLDVDVIVISGTLTPLAANPDHASRDSFFGTSGELTHAVDPSCGIGVKQLVMQRVRG